MPGNALRVEEAVRALSDPNRRVPPGRIRELEGLDQPGLYAWFVDREGATALTRGLGSHLAEGLIYAGQTGAGRSSATLSSRVAGNHTRGNIRGSTFRLTLAAALSHPLRLKPIAFRRTTPDAEVRLTTWIDRHLEVSVFPYQDRWTLDHVESEVLAVLDPPLNLSKMQPSRTREALTALRRPFMRKTVT
jgi:hypothetical protein